MSVGEPWLEKMSCPHCGVFSQFSKQAGVNAGEVMRLIVRCVSCGQDVLLTLSNETGALLDYYPRLVRALDPSIPQSVAAALIEAQKCFDVGAHNACATMCRRAVQAAVVERGGHGDSLFKQIDDLAQQRLITPALQEWAHEVRIIGKVGAHADEPIQASPDDARDGLAFADELFDHLYVIPARLAKRRVDTTTT
jgi:transcription elongation factor Elf1